MPDEQQLRAAQSPGNHPEQYLWGCQHPVSEEPEITNGVISLLLGCSSRCLPALPARRALLQWFITERAGSQRWLCLPVGAQIPRSRPRGSSAGKERAAGERLNALPAGQHAALWVANRKPKCYWERQGKQQGIDSKEGPG